MKPFWTIAEACVWAATREAAAVDAVTQGDPEGVDFLFGDDALPSAAETLFGLPAVCADGRLTMYGTERDQGDTVPIPRDAWAELELSHMQRWRGFVAAVRDFMTNPEARWWTRLKVRSADVLEIWPAMAGDSGQPPDADGMAKVRAVVERVKVAGKQLKRGAFNAMVRELVDPRIRTARLDELWRELADESWRKRGQGAPPPGLMVEDWKSWLPRA